MKKPIFPSAEESRRKTQQALPEVQRKLLEKKKKVGEWQIKRIKEKIEEACLEGKDHVIVEELRILWNTQTYLLESGYSVDCFQQNSGTPWITISWKELTPNKISISRIKQFGKALCNTFINYQPRSTTKPVGTPRD